MPYVWKGLDIDGGSPGIDGGFGFHGFSWISMDISISVFFDVVLFLFFPWVLFFWGDFSRFFMGPTGLRFFAWDGQIKCWRERCDAV